MTPSEESHPARAKIPICIFAVLVPLLLYFHGQRMVLTNDEGIILDAAQRMVHGQRPYIDFFGYMSPGSYWLQALVFQIGGVALWTGRLIVIADLALQSALVFWLADRLATRKTAIAACLTFTGFQIAEPAFLTAAHRWDSATFAFAALTLAIWALDHSTRWSWYAVGALFAVAAWCTPSVALVGVVTALWLLLSSERRAHLLGLALGAAAVFLAGVAMLAATGSLGGFLNQMLWLSHNYTAVNVMPYGSIISGYGALFEDTNGALELIIRVILVMCVALPAILPPLSLLCGGVCVWRRQSPDRAVLLLLLAAVPALVFTTFPRADVGHLAFIAALPYALTAICLSRILSQRLAPFLGLAAVLLAGLLSSHLFLTWSSTRQVPSPVGLLRVEPNVAEAVGNLMARVHRGDSMFVYPYIPVDYFLTQTRNPTTYSYLAPGMMKDEDEMTALGQLRQDPPQWLLYMKLTRTEYLRVFPNATGLNWRFETLEDWLQQHYQRVEDPAANIRGYVLWKRNAADSASTR